MKIKMKTRTDLLNFLAEKYNLKRFLEIGVQNPEQNFNKIKCEYKVGVDQALRNVTYGNVIDGHRSEIFAMTSDEFFESFTVVEERFDGKETKAIVKNGEVTELYNLIFIDGLHHADQVKKDFENALQVLSSNGFIVLHDCNPLKEEHTIVPRPTERGHWNGDVYKFAAQLCGYIGINYVTVDIDNGCSVIWQDGNSLANPIAPVTWDYFDKNRKELLNLVSWQDFIKL